MHVPSFVSIRLGLFMAGLMTLFSACAQPSATASVAVQTSSVNQVSMDKLSVATFGGGCFWCTEAVFQRLDGVEKVVSGYTGGAVPNPTYKQICTGTTGHAEVIQIHYDPDKVSFAELLEVHFATHDPTTLNRQGNDVGTQYRSAVFYHDDTQRDQAQKAIAAVEESGLWDGKVVTEVTPAVTFWPAENYHQDYFNANGNQGYCRVIIAPKVAKFKKQFADKLK